MYAYNPSTRIHLQTYEYIMSVALPAASRAFGQLIDKVTIIVDLGTWGLMDMPKASPRGGPVAMNPSFHRNSSAPSHPVGRTFLLPFNTGTAPPRCVARSKIF